MKKPLKILIVCGGASSEHEVSLRTARMIEKNLDKKKYTASVAMIEKNGKWKFESDITGDNDSSNSKSLKLGDAINKITAANFDFVFIAMHGAFGEDGRMQALLEWMHLPYSGTGVLGSAMAMDKHISNASHATNNLTVPRYVVREKHSKTPMPKLQFPVVVKPVSGGSSVGVSIVNDAKNLKQALAKGFSEDDRVMIQEYIKGREFTCGVLEDNKGKPFALPPTEIIPKDAAFFDYGAKYTAGGSREITPAQLPKAQTKEIQALALRAHEISNCRGMSRSDFILKDSTFYILEINTIPGMTETSLLPQAARAAGISFSSLLDSIVLAGLRSKK